MFSARKSLCVSILALLALTGCASQQPFSSVDRSKYKTLAFDPDIKAPDHYIYRDITGKRSRGMVGGLIGLLAGAASEGPGFHRFDAAASKNPVDIRALMRRHIDAALRTSQFLKVVPSGADTTLKLEIAAYGVGPVHERQLGAVIAAKATLVGRDGKTIWKKDEWAASNTTALLEDLEKNPDLWPRMANEAAEALARKLILYTSESERTIAQPFM